MDTTYEDTVFNFDLNFLHQTPNISAPNRPDKQRKSILIVKKKTVATDSLIRKYYAKREVLDQTEKSLLTSKEECKQICIDYRNALDTCTKLENDAQLLQLKNKELEEKCFHALNQCDAVQSHANQLQLLVKQHETVIESLKIENKLGKSNPRHDKKISTLQKEKDDLLKDICLFKDILLGKKKLKKYHKEVLQKYQTLNINGDEHSDEDSISNDDDDAFEDVPSPFCEDEIVDNSNESNLHSNLDKVIRNVKNEIIIFEHSDLKSVGNNHEYDCSTATSDTGRGSSLAYSDSEKCFPSPDNAVSNSPLSLEVISRDKKKLVHVSTSPITFHETIQRGTSPIQFEDEPKIIQDPAISYKTSQVATSPIQFDDEPTLVQEPIIIHKTRQIATSPIHFEDEPKIILDCAISYKTSQIATSPIQFDDEPTLIQEPIQKTRQIATSPVHFEDESEVLQKPVITKKTSQMATSPIQFEDEYTVAQNNVPNQRYFVNKALSPIKLTKHVEVSTSPIKRKSIGIVTSPHRTNNKKVKCNSLEIQEKECLELNNSNNTCVDNISDSEIEMIFSTMRFNHTLISPIPPTPARPQDLNTYSAGEPTRLRTQSKGHTCEEAAIAREENKKLHASMTELAKEVMNIKSLLKNQLLLSNSCMHNQDDISNQNSLHKNMSVQDLNALGVHINKDSTQKKKVVVHIEEPIENQLLHDNLKLTDHELHSNLNEKHLFTTQDKLQRENSLTQIEGQLETHEQSDEYDLYSDTDLIQIHDILDANISTQDFVEPLEDVPDAQVSQRLQFEQSVLNLSELDNASQFGGHMNEIEKAYDLTDNNNDTEVHNIRENYLKKNTDRKIKQKRLTRLEKLRKRLLPKCKIRTATPTLKKKHRKPKPLLHKKVVKESDSAASLNDKNVYDNAVKIMTELKSKQNIDCQHPENKLKLVQPKVNLRDEVLKPKIPENSISKSENITTISQKHSNDREVIKSPKHDDVIIVPRSRVTTRSQSKRLDSTDSHNGGSDSATTNIQREEPINEDKLSPLSETKRPLKRSAEDKLETPSKRVLRSSTINKQIDISGSRKLSISSPESTSSAKCILGEKINMFSVENASKSDILGKTTKSNTAKLVSYSDLQLFSDQTVEDVSEKPQEYKNPKESILCAMVDKYGIKTVKNYPNKIPESATSIICKKIEDAIAQINDLHANEANNAMKKLVVEIQNMNIKHFIVGLMKYLKDPTRKTELFNKINTPPAPPMTKSEQILLYVISQLQVSCPQTDVISNILENIEYNLFKLNRTPEFDAIETMSHFYAILCRFIKAKSRLRLFILDAMYCIQYKAIALIKQCIDVWMHILPLAHMGVAKSPLVTCLVYLLHFYKCEDRFNRVQDMRTILNRKYFYQITEWNETKILEMLKTSILDLREIPIEKKMLRMAIIIISKRHGPKWCQKHIVKKLLLPMVENECIPTRIRQFCVSLLGPIVKPYPNDMKVHCEIVMNQLLDIYEQNPSHEMKEAIITSLIFMSRHNQYRVHQLLLSWKPKKLSSDFELILRDYVREKPLKIWETTLSRVSIS